MFEFVRAAEDGFVKKWFSCKKKSWSLLNGFVLLLNGFIILLNGFIILLNGFVKNITSARTTAFCQTHIR